MFSLMRVLYPSNTRPSALCTLQLMGRLFILPTLMIATPPTTLQAQDCKTDIRKQKTEIRNKKTEKNARHRIITMKLFWPPHLCCEICIVPFDPFPAPRFITRPGATSAELREGSFYHCSLLHLSKVYFLKVFSSKV